MALARDIAGWYDDVQVVLAPAVGAISLGFAVALASGARSIFAERADGVMTLRRGFRLDPRERVLVVEDVVTTGGSAREVWELAGEHGSERLGVAALIDRTTGDVTFPLRAVFASTRRRGTRPTARCAGVECPSIPRDRDTFPSPARRGAGSG